MSIASMTGFARINGNMQMTGENISWIWEIKSVNGKSLDIKMRLPAGYDDMALTLKIIVGKYLSRGSVNAGLEIIREKNSRKIKIDDDLLKCLTERVIFLDKEYGDKLAVGVDARDGYVAIHGWKELSKEKGVDFCRRLAEAGCRAVIYTDISRDGAMQGTNLELYGQLARALPGLTITASGGITYEEELVRLKELGIGAAILGKSLYTGALDLARCVQLVQD